MSRSAELQTIKSEKEEDKKKGVSAKNWYVISTSFQRQHRICRIKFYWRNGLNSFLYCYLQERLAAPPGMNDAKWRSVTDAIWEKPELIVAGTINEKNCVDIK